MTKHIALFILAIIIILPAAFSQTSKKDSLIKQAKTDAKSFRLSDSIHRLYKQHHFANTSDYFKPGKANVKDTTLLNDSAYVSAFRNAAYKNNKHRRTAGHYVLLGGIIAGAAAVVMLVAIIIFIAPKMG